MTDAKALALGMRTYSECFTKLAIYITIITNSGEGNYIIPDLKTEVFVKSGDLNLGGLALLVKSRSGGSCSSTLRYRFSIQAVESIAYAVDRINNDSEVLPNITLGYMIFPTCHRDIDTLAKAMNFISEINPTTQQMYREDGLNRIIGVLGMPTSRESVMASPVLSLFNIPHISVAATSDDLSNKTRFEHFLRMVPSDKFQSIAMVDILTEMNWTYVSFLYSAGSYGEGAAGDIEVLVKERGICLAYAQRIPSLAKENDFDQIVEALWKNYKAKVVLLFISSSHQKLLVRILKRRKLHQYFIFLGSDSFFPKSYENFPGIKINLQSAVHNGFEKYFRNLKPYSNPYENPWMDRFWTKMESCEDELSVPISLCGYNVTRTNLYRYIDAVNIYAYATDRLIRWKCPDALKHKELLDRCVTGDDLLETIKNGSYPGYLSSIAFDTEGNFMGHYQIFQLNYDIDEYVSIGYWSVRDRQLESFDIELLSWEIYDNYPNFKDLPLPEGFPVLVQEEENITKEVRVPESVCSKPCQAKEYLVRQEVQCCWECRTCRNNERLLPNDTGCETCPSTTWPDDETATVCVSIPPTYMTWTDVKAIVLSIMAILGIISSSFVFGFYLIKNKHKLIKASGRELSYMTLGGIYMAFITVIPFVAKPNHLTCICSRFGFNLSVTLLYGPLLLKTLRIYRIFSAGKKGKKVLRGTGSGVQIILASLIVFAQILLSSVTAIIAPPIAKLRMKIPTQKHVELFCNQSLDGLLAPMTLNILLLLLCAVFGFLTRKLPENFNESLYIFISVTTTSFLWMLFLPTYFTQFYAYNQAALLAFCLILNASVTLVCLYVPKVYAIYFVDQDKIKYETTGTAIRAATTRVDPPTVVTTDSKKINTTVTSK